jgi:uncharacterized protein YbjT (DUF2867 family)
MRLRDIKHDRVLLTGASGFVGRHLYHALQAVGCEVHCASRKPHESLQRYPERTWVHLDLDDPATLDAALTSCTAAYYLIHGMGDGADYEQREAQAATAFADAAKRAGLRRIVYLGGVEPAGTPSRHLRSRLATGRLLRQSEVSTVELRAAMIIGRGGSSWEIVRDLAARLPLMVLPKWLRNRSHPVAIVDVVFALLVALALPDEAAGVYDIPGLEQVSHQELLQRVAAYWRIRPVMINVPILTPRLSSYWIRFVTRADWHLAKELVAGLTSDLIPADEGLWALVSHYHRVSLDNAIRMALADEKLAGSPSKRSLEAISATVKAFQSCPFY